MKRILLAAVVLASCAAPGTRDANLPAWAVRGSGVFKDESGAPAIYGRGVAAEVRVPELGRSISRERGREDVLEILTAVLAEHTRRYLAAHDGPASVAAMQDFVKLVVNNEEDAAHYITPDARRHYALVKLDVALIKRKLSESPAIDAGLRDYLLAHLDESAALPLPLHREASEQDAPVVETLPDAKDVAAPAEWDASGKNAVLYHADLGLRLQYQGHDEDAARELDAAAARSRELAALAVARSSATTFLDEADAEYASGPAESAALERLRSAERAASDAAPVPPGTGVLVLVHYNGPARRKIAKRWSVSGREGDAALERLKKAGDPALLKSRVPEALSAAITVASFTVAAPEFAPASYVIAGSELRAGGASAVTTLAADVFAPLARELEDLNAAARTRRVAYALIRHRLARLNDADAARKYGPNSWQHLLTLKTTDATRATPSADLRSPRDLPAQIRTARLALPPGVHDVTVVYKDAAGATVSTETFKGVTVVAGRKTYLRARTER